MKTDMTPAFPELTEQTIRLLPYRVNTVTKGNKGPNPGMKVLEGFQQGGMSHVDLYSEEERAQYVKGSESSGWPDGQV